MQSDDGRAVGRLFVEVLLDLLLSRCTMFPVNEEEGEEDGEDDCEVVRLVRLR